MNHMAATQDDLLMFRLWIRIGNKGDLRDFELGMVVGGCVSQKHCELS